MPVGSGGSPLGRPLGRGGSPLGSGGKPGGKPPGKPGKPEGKPDGSGGSPEGKPPGSGGKPEGRPDGSGGRPDGKPPGRPGKPEGKPDGSGGRPDGKPPGGAGKPEGKPDGSGGSPDGSPDGSGGSPLGSGGKPDGNGGRPGNPEGSPVGKPDGRPVGVGGTGRPASATTAPRPARRSISHVEPCVGAHVARAWKQAFNDLMSASCDAFALCVQLCSCIAQAPNLVGSLPAPLRHVSASARHCSRLDANELYACCTLADCGSAATPGVTGVPVPVVGPVDSVDPLLHPAAIPNAMPIGPAIQIANT